MEEDEHEEILFILRKSRRAFLVEYLCSFILFALLILTYFKKINLPKSFQYLVLGVALISLFSAEFSRLMVSYRVTTSKVTIVHGLIKQTRKNVNFHPLSYVPDINMKQTVIQRLLGYGTVYVDSQGGSFEFKEIAHPQKILGQIEGLIEKARKSRS